MLTSAVRSSSVKEPCSIRRWPVWWFPKWNWSPQNAARQHNAASCPRCARHMWAGLVYQGPMFYLACVKAVQMCTSAWPNICVSKGAKRTLINSRSQTWLMNSGRRSQAETSISQSCFRTHPPVQANVCVSIWGWYLIHRMSLNLVTLVWTKRNADATLNRRLGWLCCNNPDIIKNKRENTTITTH